MNKSANDQSRLHHRKQIAAIMGACITLGIVLGAALGNIALGLAVGILIGGAGVLLRTKAS